MKLRVYHLVFGSLAAWVAISWLAVLTVRTALAFLPG